MRTKFFYELRRAWNALAFDRYDLADAYSAADDLNCYSCDGHSAVKVSDPVQIKVLDALTEAVGISHQKGQSQIQILERLRGDNYWQDAAVISVLQTKLEAAEQRIADKDAVIDDLRRRLDAEAEERRRLTALLTDQRVMAPGRTPGWLANRTRTCYHNGPVKDRGSGGSTRECKR